MVSQAIDVQQTWKVDSLVDQIETGFRSSNEHERVVKAPRQTFMLIVIQSSTLQSTHSAPAILYAMAGGDTSRFSTILPTDYGGSLWIVSILAFAYSFMVAAVRIHVKWGMFGHDDALFGLATVCPTCPLPRPLTVEGIVTGKETDY